MEISCLVIYDILRPRVEDFKTIEKGKAKTYHIRLIADGFKTKAGRLLPLDFQFDFKGS